MNFRIASSDAQKMRRHVISNLQPKFAMCNDRLAVGMNSKESIYFKYNFKISGYVQNATAYLHVQNLIFVNLNIAFRLIRKRTFLDL